VAVFIESYKLSPGQNSRSSGAEAENLNKQTIAHSTGLFQEKNSMIRGIKLPLAMSETVSDNSLLKTNQGHSNTKLSNVNSNQEHQREKLNTLMHNLEHELNNRNMMMKPKCKMSLLE